MVERIVIVCDVCGGTPTESVGLKLKNRNLVKDLCAKHMAELVKGASAPKRGRRRGSAIVGPLARARRVAQATASDTSTVAKPRRPITDPAVLEKRRAALTKARQVRAEKRAARLAAPSLEENAPIA